MALEDLPRIPSATKLTGAQRAHISSQVAAVYLNDHASIRDISAETGRSNGAIHRLLREAGVALRDRETPHASPATPNALAGLNRNASVTAGTATEAHVTRLN